MSSERRCTSAPGRRKSLPLALVAVGLTLAALAASEYFILHHFAVQELIAEGYTKVEFPLFLPLQDMVDIVVGSISEQPTNLLYWAAACYGAFILPSRGRNQR